MYALKAVFFFLCKPVPINVLFNMLNLNSILIRKHKFMPKICLCIIHALNIATPIAFIYIFVCLISCLISKVNSLCHVGTVSYPNHTFSRQAVPKWLTST